MEHNAPLTDLRYQTACKECGTLIKLPAHLSIARYHCPRCGAMLYRRGQPFAHVLIMAITALVLFVPLSFLPILDLKIMGMENEATLFEALWTVYEDGYYPIAFLALFTGLLSPVVMLLLLVGILLPLQMGFRPAFVGRLYRWYENLREWGMAEVYLISIVVAMVKLHGMGTLKIGLGFYMFIFFFITFYIATVWFNPDDIWQDDGLDT